MTFLDWTHTFFTENHILYLNNLILASFLFFLSIIMNSANRNIKAPITKIRN